MKKYFIPLLILAQLTVHAQQWVQKQYAYNSFPNVVYGTSIGFNHDPVVLTMDIYEPVCDEPDASTAKPLLMWIHGGAFLYGSKEDPSITRLCKSFAERGYVTASINYRLGFVADDVAWSCNYPNYSCVFAVDTAEWYRAYYRGIQDAKGALRYLINRHSTYGIDTNNVFVAGESAGAFLALGVALLDTSSERMTQTYLQPSVPNPHSSTHSCEYNLNTTFSGNEVERPDLGGVEGDIEPTDIQFVIKGIGNNYGGMMTDLLKDIPAGKPRPAIYSFHQPCDLIVPIDRGRVFEGLSWCFTHGYGCSNIVNTPLVNGSRKISEWNSSNNYGYDIHDEFTNVNFPYNFLIGTGSCLDQVNNPCHAYDAALLREENLANFFAGLIGTHPFCTPVSSGTNDLNGQLADYFTIFPSPVKSNLHIKQFGKGAWQIALFNTLGQSIYQGTSTQYQQLDIDMQSSASGVYYLFVNDQKGRIFSRPIVKI